MNANLDLLNKSILKGFEEFNKHFVVIKLGLDKSNDGIIKNTSQIKSLKASQVTINQLHADLAATMKNLKKVLNHHLKSTNSHSKIFSINQLHADLEARVKELTTTVNKIRAKVDEDQLQSRHSEMVTQTE